MRIYYEIHTIKTKCKTPFSYNIKEYEENDAFFKEYVEASKIFGDQYTIDKNKISPKSGELENHHVIDILDKCLSIVKICNKTFSFPKDFLQHIR